MAAKKGPTPRAVKADQAAVAAAAFKFEAEVAAGGEPRTWIFADEVFEMRPTMTLDEVAQLVNMAIRAGSDDADITAQLALAYATLEQLMTEKSWARFKGAHLGKMTLPDIQRLTEQLFTEAAGVPLAESSESSS